jgi:hypothetical protein
MENLMTVETEKHSGGRPTKLTPEVMDKLIRYIRRGHSYDTACRACGICRRTRQNWMKRGEKESDRIEFGETPDDQEAVYVEFYHRADQADAMAEIEDINFIRSGKQGWAARAWLRARKNPTRWGNNGNNENTEDFGKPFQGVIRVIDM